MKTKAYSSEMVRQLLENTRWRFWSKDWTKSIVVQWDAKKGIILDNFKQDIIKIVGKNFKYERSLSIKNTEFIATKTGLTKI